MENPRTIGINKTFIPEEWKWIFTGKKKKKKKNGNTRR